MNRFYEHLIRAGGELRMKLSPTKHRLVASICKMVEQKLSTKEILDRTPLHYGETVTYDHLNFLFDRTYDRLANFGYVHLTLVYLTWVIKPKRKDLA